VPQDNYIYCLQDSHAVEQCTAYIVYYKVASGLCSFLDPGVSSLDIKILDIRVGSSPDSMFSRTATCYASDLTPSSTSPTRILEY
jgi:hypothetical protein